MGAVVIIDYPLNRPHIRQPCGLPPSPQGEGFRGRKRMDDIIEAVFEIVGTIIEEIFDNIKSPRKRKWALTAFYSVFTLIITGFFLWGTVALAAEGSRTGAIAFGIVSGGLFLLSAFFIIRGHRRSWKRGSKRKR